MPTQDPKTPRKSRASQSTTKKTVSRTRKAVATKEAVASEVIPSEVIPSNGKTKPNLYALYADHVVPTMMQEFSYKNVMQVPRINKIVLNMGVGEAKDNIKALESATEDLTIIAGQKPIITRARKAIAGFKIRKDMPIGVAVTLRGDRMGYFFDRLLNIALPRIRDFRGVPRSSFDGRGNYSLGIREQVIFPEIDYNQIDRIRGLQVTITTSAETDGEAIRLLELLGMPFVR